MYALLAASFSIGKVLLRYTTPVFLTGIRMLLAGIILLAYQYFSPQEQFKFKRSHLKYYIQITFFGIYATYILRFWALKDLPSYKAVFLYNLAPFSTALLSYIFFKEKLTKKQMLGLAVGLLGLVPILLTSSKPEAALGEWFSISWQELAVIASVISSSYSWILIRKMVQKKNYSPMMINGICMTTGGALALATALLCEQAIYIKEPVTFTAWLCVVIVISNILCHNMYGFLLKEYTATFISFASFLSPLFAAFYGWAFLQETISWNFYASSAIVFAGLFLFYQDELKNRTLSTIVE